MRLYSFSDCIFISSMLLFPKCSAKVCKDLIHYYIDHDKCVGCHICFKACPVDAISGDPKQNHTISQEDCIQCGICYEKCPPKFNAIELNPGILNMEVNNG